MAFIERMTPQLPAFKAARDAELARPEEAAAPPVKRGRLSRRGAPAAKSPRRD